MALPTASINLIRAGTQLAGEKVGAGRSILLLHAGGETRDVWRPVMQDLARRGYASQAYDQRGHGESGGSTRDGFLAYGEDAEAMIEAMHRPVVVEPETWERVIKVKLTGAFLTLRLTATAWRLSPTWR